MSEKGRNNRQRRQVNWIKRRYPGAWWRADALRKAHRQDWPSWCYLPMQYWSEIAACHQEPNIGMIPDIARLAALGAWRVTQGIYRFDADLYASLIDTPLSGDLPDALLYRLPSWGVYVETPGLTFIDAPLQGVYAHLEYDLQEQHTELRLLLDGPADSPLFLFAYPIRLGHGSLLASIAATGEAARRNAARLTHIPGLSEAVMQQVDGELFAQNTRDLTPILALLLYLCAEEADYESPPRLKTARPRALEKQRIVVIPEQVRTWDVGARIGAALRATRDRAEAATAPAPGERARPRAHWRRAHFHTFWTGPIEGERIARVKWLPPIPVGLDGQELPAVIHPVRP
jgi:hypothetical protein